MANLKLQFYYFKKGFGKAGEGGGNDDHPFFFWSFVSFQKKLLEVVGGRFVVVVEMGRS